MLWDWVFSKLLSDRNAGFLAAAGALIAAGLFARVLSWLNAPKVVSTLGGFAVALLIAQNYWVQISEAADEVRSSIQANAAGAGVSNQNLVVLNACEQLTPEQVASLLYVAGFRGDDLVHLLAIGKRESGYKPAAHRSDKDKSLVIGDRGLFQINYIHDPRLKAAGIITTASDLFDPLVNARAAWFLFAEQGLFPWNMTAGGWQANGVPFHATNVDAARVAVERAGQQGLLTGDLAEYERQTAACATEVL